GHHRQGGESGDRFSTLLPRPTPLHGNRHHRFAHASPRLLFLAPFHAPYIASVDLQQPPQLILLLAIGHGLADLVLHQPSGGVGYANFLAQLQCRDPFLALAHPVKGPEPTQQGYPSLMENRPRRHRALVGARGALIHTSRDNITPTTPTAARTGETLQPALRGKIPGARPLLGKLAAKFPHRHHALSGSCFVSFHHPTISLFVRLIKLDMQ